MHSTGRHLVRQGAFEAALTIPNRYGTLAAYGLLPGTPVYAVLFSDLLLLAVASASAWTDARGGAQPLHLHIVLPLDRSVVVRVHPSMCATLTLARAGTDAPPKATSVHATLPPLVEPGAHSLPAVSSDDTFELTMRLPLRGETSSALAARFPALVAPDAAQAAHVASLWQSDLLLAVSGALRAEEPLATHLRESRRLAEWDAARLWRGVQAVADASTATSASSPPPLPPPPHWREFFLMRPREAAATTAAAVTETELASATGAAADYVAAVAEEDALVASSADAALSTHPHVPRSTSTSPSPKKVVVASLADEQIALPATAAARTQRAASEALVASALAASLSPAPRRRAPILYAVTEDSVFAAPTTRRPAPAWPAAAGLPPAWPPTAASAERLLDATDLRRAEAQVFGLLQELEDLAIATREAWAQVQEAVANEADAVPHELFSAARVAAAASAATAVAASPNRNPLDTDTGDDGVAPSTTAPPVVDLDAPPEPPPEPVEVAAATAAAEATVAASAATAAARARAAQLRDTLTAQASFEAEARDAVGMHATARRLFAHFSMLSEDLVAGAAAAAAELADAEAGAEAIEAAVSERLASLEAAQARLASLEARNMALEEELAGEALCGRPVPTPGSLTEIGALVAGARAAVERAAPRALAAAAVASIRAQTLRLCRAKRESARIAAEARTEADAASLATAHSLIDTLRRRNASAEAWIVAAEAGAAAASSEIVTLLREEGEMRESLAALRAAARGSAAPGSAHAAAATGPASVAPMWEEAAAAIESLRSGLAPAAAARVAARAAAKAAEHAADAARAAEALAAMRAAVDARVAAAASEYKEKAAQATSALRAAFDAELTPLNQRAAAASAAAARRLEELAIQTAAADAAAARLRALPAPELLMSGRADGCDDAEKSAGAAAGIGDGCSADSSDDRKALTADMLASLDGCGADELGDFLVTLESAVEGEAAATAALIDAYRDEAASLSASGEHARAATAAACSAADAQVARALADSAREQHHHRLMEQLTDQKHPEPRAAQPAMTPPAEGDDDGRKAQAIAEELKHANVDRKVTKAGSLSVDVTARPYAAWPQAEAAATSLTAGGSSSWVTPRSSPTGPAPWAQPDEEDAWGLRVVAAPAPLRQAPPARVVIDMLPRPL